MAVIGTAGHVDHGKSTLIQALSGRDPDRWDEEKRRGLTIDLGFAWTTVGGREISFVDVPGHERFVKNMLAGIEAVDAAILVVAADEGWMPQTEEHAAVLDLLELGRVVVAITKSDRVQSTGPVREEIRERLEGLGFANAPMVDLAAPTGHGLEELRSRLAELIDGIGGTGPPVPHLWIDRAFSIPGVGTVVTGTLQGGPMARADRVTIQPSGSEARIRGLQTHERDAEVAEPHRRLAINLGGLSVEDVPRGTLLVKGNAWSLTDRLLATIRPARYADLDERGAFHLHMGSGMWPAQLQLVDGGSAVFRLSRQAPVVFGARFVLRESGRRLVVAGGRALDPQPPRQRRHLLEAARHLTRASTPDAAATALLHIRQRAAPDDLSRDTAGGRPVGGVTIGSDLYAERAAHELRDRGTDLLEQFHNRFPLRSGMPVASLAEALQLSPGAVDELVSIAGWRRVGAAVSLSDHESALPPEDEERWHRLRAILAPSLRVPRINELDMGSELLAALLAQGRVIRVSDDLLFLPEQLNSIEDRIRGFSEPFTVSEFRQSLDLSRKYAVPLLEWFDKRGVTQRRGDVRVVREGRRPEA